MEVSGSLRATPAFPWENNLDAHLIEGWIVYRAGLDAALWRKFFVIPRIESRFLARPARSLVTILTEQYRLRNLRSAINENFNLLRVGIVFCYSRVNGVRFVIQITFD
jgi:hypothetical protein